MMRSMFSGVSGLRTHQQKMDVIGNNIANVNTVGFKSSRVTFKEVFSQTVSGASGANVASGRGGVNPMQIGLGVSTASIDNIMTQGMAQRTDYTMDLMIDGDGFFIVSDADGTYFTRMGAMYTDEQGNLTLSGTNGLLVNGWYAKEEKDADGNITGDYVIDKGFVEPIRITGEYEYMMPEVTTSINYSGNLNARTNPTVVTQMSFYDSLGNRYVMDVKYENPKAKEGTPDDPTDVAGTTWEVSFSNVMYLNGDKDKPVYLNNSEDSGSIEGGISGTKPPDDYEDNKYTKVGEILFNTKGEVVTTEEDYITKLNLIIDTSGSTALNPNAVFASEPNGITINFTEMTQFDEKSSPSARALDGQAAGMLNGISLGPTGEVTGRYSNGETRLIAQIAVATFENPAGLEKAGSNLYIPTRNSGEFNAGEAYSIDEVGGSFMVGSLEMSNVDLSSEFTDMIVTQRGFQANSRIITVSDEMLQELVNLKR